MKNLIHIVDLEVNTIIGVYPEERNSSQLLIINVTVSHVLDFKIMSDCLDDTIDYYELESSIINLVKNRKAHLIEVLAEEIASMILSINAVEKVTVRIDKPGALRASRSAAIELVRTQD